MPDLVPLRLAYRVIDANTGAEVAGNLPHLHQSAGSVHALQRGYPGSATIGSFRILLPDPASDEGRRNRTLYLSLVSGQKVEGYLGDVIAGAPRISGVITKIDRPLDGPWVVECMDTLFWLQQSQVLVGESLLAQTLGTDIVKTYMGTMEVVWDDDFSTWAGAHPNSTDYNVSGFTSTGSDPNLGLPALTATAVANNFVVTKTTWAQVSQYSASSVSIHGTMQVGSDPTNGGDASIYLLSDATGANGIILGAFCRDTGTPGTVIDGRIYTISSGTLTLRAQAAGMFGPLENSLLQFEVTAVVYSQPGVGVQIVRLLVNGKDAGITYPILSPLSGAVGLRFSPSGAGGSPQIWVNRLQFRARTGNLWGTAWGTNRFAQGAGFAANRKIFNTIVLSGQTHLDMLLLASSLDGYWIRKTPGAGPKADSLDYAVSPGLDLSSSIVFEEEANVVASGTAVSPVPEVFATDVKMAAIPGADSGGSVTWGRIGAAGDMVLTDLMADLGTPGFSLLVGYAETVQARKVQPQQATQVAVSRTPDTADAWRELDTVMVHIPSLGIYHQKAQVVGWTFDEATTEQTVYLNQFPIAGVPRVAQQRVVRPLDFLTNQFQPRT